MEIMKFFKKALVATAIMSTITAANAATVSSDPLKLSSEGIAYKVAQPATTLTFDIVVDNKHPSASTITLAFDSNVEFDALDCGGTVTQGVASGTSYCGDIGFDYGTGSFTFDNVKVTDGDATKGENDSISFDVNLGNPLTADSAFRVVLGDHNGTTGNTGGGDAIVVKGASTLTYSSEDAAEVAIETGTGVIATETSQFGFVVTKQLDGIASRDTEIDFIGSVDADVFGFSITNDETLTYALANVAANVALSGNFKDVGTFSSNTTTATTLSYAGTSTSVVNIVMDNAALATKTEKETVTFSDTGTVKIPLTGAVTAKATVTAATNIGAGASLPTGGFVIATGLAAGSWELDATVINVPYLPVGYAGTSSSIHFANETSSDADVIVTAIDDDGVEYGPLDLGKDLEGDTVTKVSQTELMSLFDIEEPTKLSVTFNIDADDGDVNAYAYTQADGKGRSEISNSQLKGIKQTQDL
jgi:hypothetical protein